MLSITTIYSQTNLVYNGDFELYNNCPTQLSTPGDMQIEYCKGWYAPTQGTSDYFNACNSSLPPPNFTSVPNNVVGYQPAQSGQAYVGLIPIANFPGSGDFWFEYLQGKLIHPLEKTRTYFLSFYISVSNYANNEYFLKNHYFGAFFSEDSINRIDWKPFSQYLPQVYYNENIYISDTTNWIYVSGEFTANGGEKYITIGMFKDSTNLDTICSNPPYCSGDFSTYYYIDNVQLIENSITPNIFTPNNDGVNDLWSPTFYSVDEVFEIYNRWGNKIYTLNSQSNGWNGQTNKEQDCPDGVYFYVSNKKQKGTIHLIR